MFSGNFSLGMPRQAHERLAGGLEQGRPVAPADHPSASCAVCGCDVLLFPHLKVTAKEQEKRPKCVDLYVEEQDSWAPPSSFGRLSFLYKYGLKERKMHWYQRTS